MTQPFIRHFGLGFLMTALLLVLLGSAARAEDAPDLKEQVRELNRQAALLIEEKNDFTGAMALLEQAETLMPLSGTTQVLLLRCEQQLGKFTDAVTRIDAILLMAKDPRLKGFLWTQRGMCNMALSNSAEAIPAFEKALTLSNGLEPDLIAACKNNLAWMYAVESNESLRKPDRALFLATQSVDATESKDPVPLDTQAAAYARCGQYAKAVAAQEKAIALLGERASKDFAERLALYKAGKPYTKAAM